MPFHSQGSISMLGEGKQASLIREDALLAKEIRDCSPITAVNATVPHD